MALSLSISMRFWRVLFLVILISSSCEDYSKDSGRINFQGITQIDKLNMGTGGISIDSVVFSSSKVRYLLTGYFIMDEKEEFFTVYFDQHPLSPEAKVDVFSFDSEFLNDELSDCSVLFQDSVCEITWSGDESRIYLKEGISEEH